MSISAVIDIAIPLITFILLASVGTDLKAVDFRRLFRRSRMLSAGLLVPPLVLPALALGLIAVAQPPAPVASGLLLIAMCPVGGISNTFTFLARASTALSVALTTLSCLMAPLTVPAIGAGLALLSQQRLVTRVPVGGLLKQLLATVALPVSLGMIARARWPDLTDQYRPTLQRLGFALLALLLVLIVLADVRGFLRALPFAVPLAAAFVASSFVVGGGIAHALGGDARDRATLAIEFATRNVAVATMIAVTILGRVDFATFASAYFLTELPLMTAAVVALRPALARAHPESQEPVSHV